MRAKSTSWARTRHNGREGLMNILTYVGFEKLCNVIKNFPELNRNFVQGDITFPLLYSSRAILWQKDIIMNYKRVWTKLIQ